MTANLINNINIQFPNLNLETQCLLVHNPTPNTLITCFIEATPNEEYTLNSFIAQFYRSIAHSLDNKKPIPKNSLGNITLNNKWQFLNCQPISYQKIPDINITWLYSEITLT